MRRRMKSKCALGRVLLFILLFSWIGLDAYGADGDPVSAPPGVIAIVNGKDITLAQIQEMIRSSGQSDTPQLRATYKNQLIVQELLRQEALKDYSLENRPEVKKAIEQAKEAASLQVYLREHVKPEPVTDEMVKKAFRGDLEKLGRYEYKVRMIQVGDDELGARLITRLKNGADFAELARLYSLASNRDQRGDMGWVNVKLPVRDDVEQSLPLPIAREIARLKPGQFSTSVVKWNDTRLLLKLEDIRLTAIPSYDDVKEKIRQNLEGQAWNKAVMTLAQQLAKNAKIAQ
ncbi:peptidyl-prolyl cis-trans isomerase [Herbaspirillum rubrisubalbicans]|uniref:peptidyl-prolyl cis-trans isomerase n=1 Tax=Herbaspirillum rubrisubalbicans TaxID=80842 RepID=UPI00265733F8|nr:peptidyl-prolyl cis-trans isomerase [Herbaspirillum rubrisubalbicans]